MTFQIDIDFGLKFNDKKDKLFNCYEHFILNLKKIFKIEIKDPGCLNLLKFLESTEITKGRAYNIIAFLKNILLL